jgi:hypothetical protein
MLEKWTKIQHISQTLLRYKYHPNTNIDTTKLAPITTDTQKLSNYNLTYQSKKRPL